MGRLLPALLLSLTVGCTLGLVYNHADWLALWQLDRYFDLTSTQKRLLGARLTNILERHRAEALPKYRAFLGQLQHALHDELTDEEVDWVFDAYVDLRTDLFELLVEDGAEFLASVDERQLRYLARKFQRENTDLADRLAVNQQRRLAERASATIEWVEDWLGPLTPMQEERVRAMSLALPDTLEAWLDYRRDRQRAFLALVRDSAEAGQPPRQPLREWLVYPERGAPVAYLAAREDMRREVRNMALAIDRMITPEQRRHLLAELEDLINDLHDLTGTERRVAKRGWSGSRKGREGAGTEIMGGRHEKARSCVGNFDCEPVRVRPDAAAFDVPHQNAYGARPLCLSAPSC